VTKISDQDYMVTVLDLYFRADCHSDLFWRTDHQFAPVTFFAMCSDFFDWATADCEQITKENLPLLLQTYEDCKKINALDYFDSLFAARVRKMRPMRQVKFSDEKLKALFDACGPER
jgi:hypothetical protein